MLALDIALRWMHILSAIALMGGSLFVKFALLTPLAQLPPETRDGLKAEIRRRWAKVVMASVGFLLLSGLVNMARIMANYEFPGTISTPLYHALLGTKFLLALPIFFIASRLAGRSEAAARFRERESKWLSLNLTLALIVVCLGGVLRFAERERKSEAVETIAAPVAAMPASPAR